jgi:hypothetical protein
MREKKKKITFLYAHSLLFCFIPKENWNSDLSRFVDLGPYGGKLSTNVLNSKS